VNVITAAMELVETTAGVPFPATDPFGQAVGDALVVVEDDGDEPDWQERALCAQTDPEAFFPEKGGSTREAKRICSGCEVRAECLEYALAHDERFGIWGGLSERERRRLRRAAG
jgi:WhiB family transcriptional regulator, redox-sensing transcriptional regulator